MSSPVWSHSLSSSSCCHKSLPSQHIEQTCCFETVCVFVYFPSRLGVSKLQLVGHIWPFACFCAAWNKNGVYIFKWLGKNQKEISISWHVKMIQDLVRYHPWLLSCYNGRTELLGQRPCVACKAHDTHRPALYEKFADIGSVGRTPMSWSHCYHKLSTILSTS